ncbi:MAG: hypothetical protein R2932_52930 [Caldilineaceae bacterium]
MSYSCSTTATLLMAYHPIIMDLTAHGGKADAQVIDVVIQELTPAHRSLFMAQP